MTTFPFNNNALGHANRRVMMATTEDGAGDRGMSERLDVAYRAYFEFRGGARKSMAAALAAVDAYDRAHAPKMRVTDEMVWDAQLAWSASEKNTTLGCMRYAIEAALSCAPGAVIEPAAAAPVVMTATKQGMETLAEVASGANEPTPALRKLMGSEPTEAPAPDPNEECVIWSGQLKRWWLRSEGGYVSGCTDDLAKASCWSRRTAEAMVRGCWPEEHVEIRPVTPRVPKPDLSALLADVARTATEAEDQAEYGSKESFAWSALAAWARVASGERTP